MNTTVKNFDNQLQEIEHYQQFPLMMPYLGPKYGSVGKVKVLLIAESNYLPENSEIHKNAEIWYGSNQNQLSRDENGWLNCRQLLECDWKSDGHKIYREINKVLSDFYDNEERAIENIAFVNGFQRPSPIMGESIKKYLTQQDLDVSVKVLSRIISIIEPDLVVFVSKLAWDKLSQRLLKIHKNVEFEYTCHPATGGRYWNKKGYMHGVNKFRKIFKKYLIEDVKGKDNNGLANQIID